MLDWKTALSDELSAEGYRDFSITGDGRIVCHGEKRDAEQKELQERVDKYDKTVEVPEPPSMEQMMKQLLEGQAAITARLDKLDGGGDILPGPSPVVIDKP